MDYFDILLAKKLNGGGGDITIEDLTITANGEYRAPSGKAYGKVTANVPAPSNAIFKQTLSGLPSPIATFTGADAPIDELIVSIDAVQEGSGDPSPSNIRPISGWTECVVNRTGKNILSPYDTGYENATVKSDGGYTTGNNRIVTGYIRCGGGVDARAIGEVKLGTNDASFSFAGIASYDSNMNFIERYAGNNLDVVRYTTPSNTAFIRFFEQIPNETLVTPSMFATYKQQLELGSEATAYQAFGNTYTIAFKDSSDNPITVYGGVIDVSGGKLTVTHANIASYNGETINEPWISSEDIYTQGATPTTGAQVVYPLTTPLIYDFDPIALRTNGVTNISVNCGEVAELKYFSETP